MNTVSEAMAGEEDTSSSMVPGRDEEQNTVELEHRLQNVQ